MSFDPALWCYAVTLEKRTGLDWVLLGVPQPFFCHYTTEARLTGIAESDKIVRPIFDF
jgi:hypothetical protein